MNALKTVGMWFLLLIMTACIVLLPQVMSAQREEQLISQPMYRQYPVRGSKKLTSKQVAQLYYDRELRLDRYQSISFDKETENTAIIQEDAAALFDLVFARDRSLCDQMKAMLTNGFLYYDRSSVLAMIDDQPIALNIVEVVVEKADGLLAFTYEEKTKTLITLSYSLEKPTYSDEDAKPFFQTVFSTIQAYYETHVGVTAKQYYYVGDLLGVAEKEDGDLLMTCFVEFGIALSGTENDKSDAMAEQIYNSDTT